MYLSLIYSLLYLLFFAVPIVFGELHHFPLGSVGLGFVPILVSPLIIMGLSLDHSNGYTLLL